MHPTLTRIVLGALALSAAGGSAVPAAAAPVKLPANGSSVTITVGAKPRQTFAGLGASSSAGGGRSYMQLAPERRARLNELLWRDARFNTLRLWFALKKYAPAPGERRFKDAFPDEWATLIRDAQAAGVKHLVLAPCAVPAYLLERLPATVKDGKEKPGAPHLKPDLFDEHAAILADFIRDAQEQHHIAIEATGLQNEPNTSNDCQFKPADIVRSVKLLRAALDARGLQQVKIIAPEAASCDGAAYAMVDALKSDEAAWRALSGVATHSYNMGATQRLADMLAGTGKDYWQTEASVTGPEEPGDFYRAATVATTFLSDMNHRVTHWIHFIGYLATDPRDNGTRIMAYDGKVAGDGWLKVFTKYYYFQQLAQTFEVGAVFRQSFSSLEKEMTWTYGHKPRITAAAARNPDGSWGLGISNFTSDDFPQKNQFQKDNCGRAAQSFTVTVNVAELAQAGELRFAARRSGPQARNAPEEPVTMRDGQLTVTIHPLELVTLRTNTR
jgi:O-glycosyl hydrolase